MNLAFNAMPDFQNRKYLAMPLMMKLFFSRLLLARVVTRTFSTDGRTDGRTDDGRGGVRDLDAL
jgi:hypothetical protein